MHRSTREALSGVLSYTLNVNKQLVTDFDIRLSVSRRKSTCATRCLQQQQHSRRV